MRANSFPQCWPHPSPGSQGPRWKFHTWMDTVETKNHSSFSPLLHSSVTVTRTGFSRPQASFLRVGNGTCLGTG